MTEFSIYQINVDRDTANVCFIGMESLKKIKGTKEVNAAAYDRVYDGKMDCISLENIYQKFNVVTSSFHSSLLQAASMRATKTRTDINLVV